MHFRIVVSLIVFLTSLGWLEAWADGPPVALRPFQVDPAVMAVIYSGSETLHYSVSWSGGIKIGDIFMQTKKDVNGNDAFIVSAKVTDYGPLKLVYPVDDNFVCMVNGPLKLPYRYEVLQKEGFGRETTRLTRYDQKDGLVWYRKNKNPEEQYETVAPIYNEFALFQIVRALVLQEGETTVVPTFVDKKRHEVQVSVVQREKRQTLFGEKTTLKVHPKMQFKGMYEKSGDSVLWLTDDRCRVPVEVHSKIVIGSLAAELVDYTNSACPELVEVNKR